MPANLIWKEWLAKAQEDASVGEEILAMGHFPSPACFHFQQATEKYLKALLLFHSKDFPKTHDLAVISKLVSEVEQEIVTVEGELQMLARYSVETRYPGDYPEVLLSEAEQAQTAMRKVADFVKTKLA